MRNYIPFDLSIYDPDKHNLYTLDNHPVEIDAVSQAKIILSAYHTVFSVKERHKLSLQMTLKDDDTPWEPVKWFTEGWFDSEDIDMDVNKGWWVRVPINDTFDCRKAIVTHWKEINPKSL